MRLLERNSSTIYYSKRHMNDEGIVYFNEPVTLSANPMPVSVDWTRVVQGQASLDVKKFLISRDSISETLDLEITEGDYFYVDVEPSEDYSNYIQGKGADYIVIGLEKTPNYTGVILKGLS